MKSLIVFLVLLVCPQLSLAAVDAWRMNQFTGKPDYYQTGIDSTTIEAIAVSTTANAARITSLESSTSTLEGRVDALEISTATLDAALTSIPDGALSSNVALKNQDNNFSASQTITGTCTATTFSGSGASLEGLEVSGATALSTAAVSGYISGRSGGYKAIAAGDTTPSVAGTHFLVYSTAANLTITNFDDGVDGQVVTILCSTPGNTITITRDHAYLPGGADATLGSADTITLVKYGAYWYAVAGPNSNS
jgi:hypothetical protein